MTIREVTEGVESKVHEEKYDDDDDYDDWWSP